MAFQLGGITKELILMMLSNIGHRQRQRRLMHMALVCACHRVGRKKALAGKRHTADNVWQALRCMVVQMASHTAENMFKSS